MDFLQTLRNETSVIPPEARAERLGRPGYVIWLTGLSGSGKSTLARELERKLFTAGQHAYILDGDDLRMGLCRDLDFSERGRAENIRRVAEVAKLFADAGLIAIVAVVSPFAADRARARVTVGSERFTEVFVDCPLAVCEQRDAKGLYKKARTGQIPLFTGVSSPYDPPEKSDVHIHSDRTTASAAAGIVLDYLGVKGK